MFEVHSISQLQLIHQSLTCLLDLCFPVRLQKQRSYHSIVTVRNSSCGKVMFSQACVKHSVPQGGLYTPLGRHPGQTLPQADTP